MTANEEDDPLERPEYVPISPDEVARISAALRERGALGPCPRCGKTAWAGATYSSSPMENVPNKRMFLGPFLGTVRIVCKHCGFLSEHDLDVLGLLPEGEQAAE